MYLPSPPGVFPQTTSSDFDAFSSVYFAEASSDVFPDVFRLRNSPPDEPTIAVYDQAGDATARTRQRGGMHAILSQLNVNAIFPTASVA